MEGFILKTRFPEKWSPNNGVSSGEVIKAGGGIMNRNRWITAFILVFISSAGWARVPVPKRPIDLNKASVRQLMVLPGIGRHRANKIVRMREHKPFRRTSELLRIKGIGRKMYQKIRPYIHVIPPKTSSEKP